MSPSAYKKDLNSQKAFNPVEKSVSKSIDFGLENTDDQNTSVDTNDIEQINAQSDNDYGILGLLLALIIGILFII